MNATEIEARIRALQEQRNTAMDQVAVLAGRLTVALSRIEELEKQTKKKK